MYARFLSSQISIKCLSKIFCVTMTQRARSVLRDRATRREARTAQVNRINHQEILQSHVTQSMRLNGTSDVTNVPPPPLPENFGQLTSNELKVERETLKSLHNHFLYLDRNLRSIESNVNNMLDILKEKDITREMRELRLEWHIVAMTMDRFFFVIFILAIVTSLITLFPKPYSIQFSAWNAICTGQTPAFIIFQSQKMKCCWLLKTKNDSKSIWNK